MIIEDITCNFYGDMQQGDNQKICMNNLVTSGIFYTRKIPNNQKRDIREDNSSPMPRYMKMDPEQEEDDYLKNYKGIFKWESNNLYVTMRNLYSLAH